MFHCPGWCIALVTLISLAAPVVRISAAVAAESPKEPAPPSAAKPQVAVIDVARAMRSSRTLMQELDRIKRGIASLRQRVTEDRERLRRMRDELSRLQEGTPAYAEMEAQVAAETLKYQIDPAYWCDPPDFLGQEGTAYFVAYQQLRAAVADYAKRHDIRLVLRCYPSPNGHKPRSAVMDAIRREGVFWSDTVDITDAVIELMVAEDRSQSADSQSVSRKSLLPPGEG
jgi:hypothetical protein